MCVYLGMRMDSFQELILSFRLGDAGSLLLFLPVFILQATYPTSSREILSDTHLP